MTTEKTIKVLSSLLRMNLAPVPKSYSIITTRAIASNNSRLAHQYILELTSTSSFVF